MQHVQLLSVCPRHLGHLHFKARQLGGSSALFVGVWMPHEWEKCQQGHAKPPTISAPVGLSSYWRLGGSLLAFFPRKGSVKWDQMWGHLPAGAGAKAPWPPPLNPPLVTAGEDLWTHSDTQDLKPPKLYTHYWRMWFKICQHLLPTFGKLWSLTKPQPLQ